jgi:hypothetical protein
MRKKIAKNLIKISILFILFGSKNFIYDFLVDNFFINKNITFTNKNEYYLTYNYNYIKNLEEFKIENKDDLLNLYYTVINSGVDKFEFYCPKEYETCIDDISEITNNQDYLSDINGFVHPFNSFDTVETTFDSMGRVFLTIDKTYKEEDINKINDKLDTIIAEVIKDEKDKKEIIKLFHDYVIEHTRYDRDRADRNIIKYASNTAYGVLFEGYGICSGYADTMGIFLNRYNIPNYKIASENHVWNAVKLDGKWYHLDLTWDDPLTDDETDIVLHDYFLISSEKLRTLDKTQHTYNDSVYTEMQIEKTAKEKELEEEIKEA